MIINNVHFLKFVIIVEFLTTLKSMECRQSWMVDWFVLKVKVKYLVINGLYMMFAVDVELFIFWVDAIHKRDTESR